MKIKVCGMRDAKNIDDLIAVKPDFMGFIFHNKSSRMVSELPQVTIPQTIKKVGVFVNENVDDVISKFHEFKLDGIQLHGNENSAYIQNLKEMLPSCIVLKAFSIDTTFNFDNVSEYESVCDYFLFDTKGEKAGGNGIKFDWSLLKNYKGKTPYLLSGGIALSDVDRIKKFKRYEYAKMCVGVDINSGFEEAPALKNIEKIKQFKKEIL